MAKIRPNQTCPCGSEIKFKKCCGPVFQNPEDVDHPEMLVRARYTALVNQDVHFLWNTLHPQSPRKLRDTESQFRHEFQSLKHLRYDELILLDGKIDKTSATLVYYVRVFDGEQDLSYLEEAYLDFFETGWFFRDALRRSSVRLGCDPLSIKVGQLETLYPWESPHN